VRASVGMRESLFCTPRMNCVTGASCVTKPVNRGVLPPGMYTGTGIMDGCAGGSDDDDDDDGRPVGVRMSMLELRCTGFAIWGLLEPE
jgi:hypothetical protein